MFKSLFTKVAGLQDYCETHLLYSHLRLYFSLGKKFHQFSINNVLLKNIKCEVIFTDTYLEPSRTSVMELFCENS